MHPKRNFGSPRRHEEWITNRNDFMDIIIAGLYTPPVPPGALMTVRASLLGQSESRGNHEYRGEAKFNSMER